MGAVAVKLIRWRSALSRRGIPGSVCRVTVRYPGRSKSFPCWRTGWRVTRQFCVAASSPLVLILLGCAKPDRVERVSSPTDGVFYTVEYFGNGPLVSDFTRVYAHLERGGKSDKKLVIDGDYLEFSKIVWDSPHDVTLCMQRGTTNTFRNEVTLSAGNASETIYNHLREVSRSGSASCR